MKSFFALNYGRRLPLNSLETYVSESYKSKKHQLLSYIVKHHPPQLVKVEWVAALVQCDQRPRSEAAFSMIWVVVHHAHESLLNVLGSGGYHCVFNWRLSLWIELLCRAIHAPNIPEFLSFADHEYQDVEPDQTCLAHRQKKRCTWPPVGCKGICFLAKGTLYV